MLRMSRHLDRGKRMGPASGSLPSATWLLLIAPLAALYASCTSTQTSTISPSASRCVVTVTNSIDTAPPSGGAGTLAITAARDCPWAASNGAAWIAITSSSSGQGDGSVEYRVAANSEPVPRSATIDVNNAAATIIQEAAECRFTVSPPATTVDATGGAVAIHVQASAACPWTATTDASWVRVTAGASGKGDGSVAVAVDANDGPARSARLLVAEATVTVTQGDGVPSAPPPPPPPPTCSYSIQPDSQTMAASGGPGTIEVTANASTCAWTAISNTAWITITGGQSATGSGRVTFAAGANTGASRTGSMSVAGRTFTLTQAGMSCSPSISPSIEAMFAGGGTSTVTVSAGASCAWTSASHASWITIASAASGTGAGTVTLKVAANSGLKRTGTATIAGQTFTVEQAAAPCTFALSPSSIDIPSGGGVGATNVTAGAGCAWTAEVDVAWITMTAGSSGTGSGTVSFNAGANPGAARSAAITVGGQTLTVTQQAAPCTFVIAPLGQTIPSAAGSGTVTVTAGETCGWTATSNNPDWLTVTDGAAGTGNGAVSFSADANPGVPRTGTLTIGGQTFTVTQDAPCTYSIDPSSQTMGDAGGSGTVTVTTGGSCSWTAVSNDGAWLTVIGVSPGIGSGQVTYTASSNTGLERTGTITIAGGSFTLTQSGR